MTHERKTNQDKIQDDVVGVKDLVEGLQDNMATGIYVCYIISD